jgi:hypothetical protein
MTNQETKQFVDLFFLHSTVLNLYLKPIIGNAKNVFKSIVIEAK